MSFTIKNGVLEKYSEEPGITEVVIPDNVTRIEAFAFDRCKSLTEITIPDSVKSIACRSFDGCKKLMKITVSEDNSLYCDIDGAVFSKDKTKLLVCPEGKSGAYTVPNGVTSIGDYAFSHCESLTEIIIPNSVTSIGESAFSYCTSLERIEVSPGNRFYTCVDGALYTIKDGIPHENISGKINFPLH